MTLFPGISREAKIISGKEALPSTSITSFEPNQTDSKSNQFPHLIYNDKNRSTGYFRATRSTDFLNVKNSPLATNLIYNWKPNERLTTKVVQAKVKIYKPAKRIEQPARPSSPYRVKVDYETSDSTFHNEKRSLEMKRLQYLKSHTSWSVYPYAAIEEREEYNKKIRETLKGQMDEKDQKFKKELEDKFMEYKVVSEIDRNVKNEDMRKKNERFKYLSKYRDDNKQLMEDRWMNNYVLKRHEWQQESQLLEQDPINWSKTLR